MSWEALDTTWLQITAGRLCCLCEATMPTPSSRGFRYCLVCVPTPADLPHLVQVAIDHQNEGWSVSFSSVEQPRFTYWLEAVTDRQLARIVERARISPHCRRTHPQSMSAWGRSSFYAHMTETQYRNLRRAWQADPRNGYEKRAGLPAGTTRRMRG